MPRRAVLAVFLGFVLATLGFALALPWTSRSTLALVASGMPALLLGEAGFWVAARHDHDPDEGYYAFMLRFLAILLVMLSAGLLMVWAKGVLPEAEWWPLAGLILGATAGVVAVINYFVRALPKPLPVWSHDEAWTA